MKRLLTVILAILLFTTTSFADSYDLINSSKNRGNSTSIGMSLIKNALNKNTEQTIKIIKNNTELNDVQNPKENEKDDSDYILGIDISKWNGNIDWNAVKNAKIEFVIIRAGYSDCYVDPYFKQNMENAIKYKMKIGVYWFSYAYTDEQAKDEAVKCYNTIKPYLDNIDLPIFWDYEYDSTNYAARKGYTVDKTLATSMGYAFCEQIKSYGLRPGIYTNIDYTNRYFSDELLDKYHTWIAQWSNSCTYKNHYIIWQCSDSYKINNKIFDLNYLYFNRYEKDIKTKG